MIFLKPKLQKKKFYQKYVHLGENTLIHCSQRTVFQFNVNLFSLKFTQPATVTQRESNQEVTKKMTDKHAAEYSKAVS